MTTAVASDGDDHKRRLEELLTELRRLDPDASLGGVATPPPSLRIRARRADLQARIDAARRAEHDRGRDDLTAALDAIVARAPTRLRPKPTPRAPARFDPDQTFWSPTAILAFRGWHVSGGVMCGAKRAWRTPRYAAGCVRGRQEILAMDVPHTGGECGAPPCGIYAAKEPGPIVDMFIDVGVPIVIGLVELAGKVVEHEYGYRAAEATVVAAVVVAESRALVVPGVETASLLGDPTSIQRLFADPQGFVERAGSERTATPGELCTMLEVLRVGYEARRAA